MLKEQNRSDSSIFTGASCIHLISTENLKSEHQKIIICCINVKQNINVLHTLDFILREKVGKEKRAELDFDVYLFFIFVAQKLFITTLLCHSRSDLLCV